MASYLNTRTLSFRKHSVVIRYWPAYTDQLVDASTERTFVYVYSVRFTVIYLLWRRIIWIKLSNAAE